MWYRVAALKPRLRPHVTISRQHYRGELWYLLDDKAHNRFHRFRPAGYAVLAAMDGSRTVDAIWRDLAELGDDRPTQDDIVQLLAQLDGADLLASDRRPDFAELAERAGANTRSKWIRRLAAPLFVQVPLVDPDRFLTLTAPLLRPLWSPLGFLLWLAVVGWGAVQAWLNWAALTHDLADRVLAADNLLILVLVFPLLKVLHELGHGYATKIFGGSVHDAGVLTMALLPMPYVDASTSTKFSPWRRIVVGASGMMVETFVAALAMALWLHIQPGAPRAAAFNVMLIAGVSTLVFNGNPLLRFDAYYILADLIGVSNLATRAARYYSYLLNRYVYGAPDVTSPAHTGGERLWFLAYAPASYLYRLTVLFSIAMLLAGLWRGLGAVLAVWTVSSALLLPLGRGVVYLVTSPTLRSRRLRAVSVTAGTLAALYALVFVLPLPSGTVAQGVVWAPEEAEVHAGVEGTLAALHVEPGAILARGQEIARLSDALLQDRAAIMQAERQEVALRYEAALGHDEVQAKMMGEQVAYFDASLKDLASRIDQLSIASPASGTFLASFAEDLPGRILKRGDLLGHVVASRDASIRVVVPQSEIELVRQDTHGIGLRFAHDPFTVLHVPAVTREVPVATRTLPSLALSVPAGGPISVDPSDPKKLQSIEVVFEMDLPLPAGVAIDRLGEKVAVRFDHGMRPLGWHIERSLRQLFLERFEL